MIWVIVAMAAVLGIVFGFAARQMQDLRDNTLTIEEQAEEIKRLTRENEGLRLAKKAHETSLEMVLAEMDQSA